LAINVRFFNFKLFAREGLIESNWSSVLLFCLLDQLWEEGKEEILFPEIRETRVKAGEVMKALELGTPVRRNPYNNHLVKQLHYLLCKNSYQLIRCYFSLLQNFLEEEEWQKWERQEWGGAGRC